MAIKIGNLKNITVDQRSEDAGNGIATGELDGVINHLKYIEQYIICSIEYYSSRNI